MTQAELDDAVSSSLERRSDWLRRAADRRWIWTVGIVAFLCGMFTGGLPLWKFYSASKVYSEQLSAENFLLRKEIVAVARGAQIPEGTIVDLKTKIKDDLVSEMGLFPLNVIRQQQASFVELQSFESGGASHYGTAGYLGHGYFITVKHSVVALGQEGRVNPQVIDSVKILYKGKLLRVKVVDYGGAAVEVDPGDWAIIKAPEELDLPALKTDTGFAFNFADPIARLGNDYDKGIAVSTGYVGQKVANNLVTCLTDGHPGVSGGGVLSQSGELVGIPVGRMQGDFRFSFILPIRSEMFRKVPHLRVQS